MVNGKRYLDYEVGVFNNGSFHNYELAAEKQVMARLSDYPIGGTGRLDQYFQPNINVSKNPLDFSRLVAGLAYKYNSHLQFAIDSQNLLYTHSQFTYNGIPNAVPSDTNALFVNFELSY